MTSTPLGSTKSDESDKARPRPVHLTPSSARHPPRVAGPNYSALRDERRGESPSGSEGYVPPPLPRSTTGGTAGSRSRPAAGGAWLAQGAQGAQGAWGAGLAGRASCAPARRWRGGLVERGKQELEERIKEIAAPGCRPRRAGRVSQSCRTDQAPQQCRSSPGSGSGG